jgi:glycosyltransferase involved in cell wall biosynthesis
MNVIASLNLLGKKVDTSKIAAAVFGHKANDLVDKCDFPIYPIDFVKEDLMPACYSAADLFIIASLEDNLPNTVIESMACEVPVVGFNVGGIPDMIRHKETGLLAESNNVQDLCDKILWMINNPEERYKMGINGKQLVEKKFTVEAQASEYFKTYKAIIAS